MCQLPVINPMRNNGSTNHQFEDPSEPIYTDPSLFERSRCVNLHFYGVEFIFHSAGMHMYLILYSHITFDNFKKRNFVKQ